MATLYEILGVKSDASLDDIKKAYRAAVLQYHPDRNSEPSAKDKFIEVEHAYSVLSDEGQRKSYDYQLNPPQTFQQAHARQGPQAPFFTMGGFQSMRRMRRRAGFTVRAKVGWNLAGCPFCAGSRMIRSFRDGHFVVDPCPQCR